MENAIMNQNPSMLQLMPLPPGNSLLGKRKTPPPSSLGNGSLQGQEPAGSAVGARALAQQGMDPNEIPALEIELDQSVEKKRRIEPVTVSKEDLDKINREVLAYYGPAHAREYFCVLCQTRLNSVLQLERHTVANEHLRRICSMGMDKSKAYQYCEVCHVACASDSIYQYHMSGKKHAKSLENFENSRNLEITILGDQLEQLLHKDVIAEGNGITLGLSEIMSSLFSLQGPFIGLQYALETGTAQEQNPVYSCSLCNVVSDANNFQLHFTSSAHRINVLKKDYPDKFLDAMSVSDTMTKKGDVSAYVRDLAAEIESKEGRKIELIKRRILRDPPKKSNYRGRGRGSSNGRGGPAQPRGRGNKRGRGRGPGDNMNGSTWTEDNYYEPNFSNQRGGGNRGKHEQPPTRGRGRGNTQRGANRGGTGFNSPYHQNSDTQGRGRGNAQRGANRGGTGFNSSHRRNSDNWNPGNTQNEYSDGYGSGRGGRRPRGRTGMNRGRGDRGWNRGGYTQNWEEDTFYEPPNWSSGNEQGSRGRARGHGGSNKGKQRSGSYSNDYNSELFGGYGAAEYDHRYSQSANPPTPSQYGSVYSPPAERNYSPNQSVGYGEPSSYSQSYSSPAQSRHFQMPSPVDSTGWGGPVISPMSVGHGSAIQQRSPPAVDSAALITNLAKSSIESEEDADAAFKISTALTQALLAYRLKSVAKNVETSPTALLALLNDLQGSGSNSAGTSSNSTS